MRINPETDVPIPVQISVPPPSLLISQAEPSPVLPVQHHQVPIDEEDGIHGANNAVSVTSRNIVTGIPYVYLGKVELKRVAKSHHVWGLGDVYIICVHTVHR